MARNRNKTGDRDTRSFAAGEYIEIPTDEGKNKKYLVRPLVARHLCELEKAALSNYRKQYIQTIKDGMDAGLIDNSQALNELQKTASWTVDNLPQMNTYSALDVPITDKLKTFINEMISLEEVNNDESDEFYRAVLAASLDNGQIDPKQIEEILGKKLRIIRVRYDQWWVTAQIEGMLNFVLTSINYDNPEVTLDEIASWPIPKLQEVARKVELLTAAQMGNI